MPGRSITRNLTRNYGYEWHIKRHRVAQSRSPLVHPFAPPNFETRCSSSVRNLKTARHRIFFKTTVVERAKSLERLRRQLGTKGTVGRLGTIHTLRCTYCIRHV